MSKYNIESFYRAVLSSNSGLAKAITGSTINVSKVPTLTSGFLTLSPDTPNEEIVFYNGIDAVAKTITLTMRGINPASTSLTTPWADYNNATFAFVHNPLAIVSADINNLHINQNPDFSLGIKVPLYANAAARDVAIPTPTNGMEVYLVAEGKFTDYTAGTWTDRASGTTSNASETVAGKAEQATLAEQGALTEIGGTGAPLFINPKNLKKVSSWAPDENRIPILNASGMVNNFVDPVPFAASSAEATAGVINNKFITPYSLKYKKAPLCWKSAVLTSFSLTEGVATIISFPTVQLNTNLFFDWGQPTRLTVQEAWVYHFNVNVYVDTTTSIWVNRTFKIQLLRNGVAEPVELNTVQYQYLNNNSETDTYVLSALVSCNALDYFQVRVTKYNTNSSTVWGNSLTTFSAFKI